MKKKHLLLACLCLCLGAVKAQTFEHYFTDRTLRVDYLFTGNAERQTICVDELSSLPRWAGRRHHPDFAQVPGHPHQVFQPGGADAVIVCYQDLHAFTSPFSRIRVWPSSGRMRRPAHREATCSGRWLCSGTSTLGAMRSTICLR